MSMSGKGETRSQTPAVCVIALTVCAGASIMVLGPIRQRLTDVRASLDEAQGIAARAGELTASAPVLEREQARVRAQVEAIERAGERVSAPSAVVSRINALAQAAGVVVDRVSPKKMEEGRIASGTIAPDAVLTTTVQASGNFEALTAFLDGLEREALLGGVRGFRLTPQLSRGTTDLSATIELVHASFSVPSKEEIAAMALAQQGAGQ
ncbi:MAG: hypothetical protein H6812_12925 [Phycisphaeraceae bacterium]|nr:hypothetical protein [Phycisphaeraceae bacterium]